MDIELYGVSRDRGFLPQDDPLASFGTEWDVFSEQLPKRLAAGTLARDIEAMPPFPVESCEADDRRLRRAMVMLSFLAHAYVWGAAKPQKTLPAVLARPWCSVAAKLGRPPVLSYASYALDNWRRLDPRGPIDLGNIALIQNFLGGIDEEWFVVVHVAIEARAGAAMGRSADACEAAARGDLTSLREHLEAISGSVDEMRRVLARMPEHCDPYIYFNRVRPYIHGWRDHPSFPEGLVYDGVEQFARQPQRFRGETGAQSSIVPALDALLGVEHEPGELYAYLLEMRDYMPPGHRAFLSMLQQRSKVRSVVQASGDRALAEAYNSCLGELAAFRSLHLHYAHRYVFEQAERGSENPSEVGTGGTPFIPYLTSHRDETLDQRLPG